MFSIQAKLGFESVPKRRHIWMVIAVFLVIAALAGVLIWIFSKPDEEKKQSSPLTPTPTPTPIDPGAPESPPLVPSDNKGENKTRFQKFWESLSVGQQALLVIGIVLGVFLVLVGVLFAFRTFFAKRPNYETIRLAAQEYVAENDVFDGNKKLSPGDLSNLSVEQFQAIAQRSNDAKLLSYATKAELEARSFQLLRGKNWPRGRRRFQGSSKDSRRQNT